MRVFKKQTREGLNTTGFQMIVISYNHLIQIVIIARHHCSTEQKGFREAYSATCNCHSKSDYEQWALSPDKQNIAPYK